MTGTRLNTNIVGMRCIRCSHMHPVADYFEGCPRCLTAGFPASVAPEYGTFPIGSGPLRPEAWLAYPGGPFLGEGRTPLIELEKLAGEVGVRRLFAKYEGAKRKRGATRRGVRRKSTTSAGASSVSSRQTGRNAIV